MSSHSPITLYDVRSNIAQPWAPNVWRVRFVLNYKRLNYRTVWLDFPDIEPTLRTIGAPPTSRKPDGRAVYTLPVIVDPQNASRPPTVLSNPAHIAEYLEVTYPARPVYPEGSRALQTLFAHYIQEIFVRPLLVILVPLTHQRLPAPSQAHLRQGSGPAPAAVHGPQVEQAWAQVQEQFTTLASILDKNSDGGGILAMSNEVSYADFVLCAVLVWIEKVSPHECWPRIRGWHGGRWARLYDCCREYMDAL